MASFALRTKLSVVHVIGLVTAPASGRRCSDTFVGRTVTTAAGQSGMAAVQGEARQIAMVETGDCPGITRMAGAALGPKRSAVHVVVEVTVNAGTRCVVEAL